MRRIMISCGIIGLGRLGGTLAQALKPLWGVTHSAVNSEEYERLTVICNRVYSSIEAIEELPECIIITVPDSQIESVAQSVASRFGAQLEGRWVLHCSGALGVDVLDSCRIAGARTASAHPFQTFATSSIDALRGIAWGIDCMPEDENFLQQLIKSLGGHPVVLTEDTRKKKAIYHATAVVASNFITILIAAAKEFADVAGIDSRLFLEPIIRQTVENSLNIFDSHTPLPLTGPIARGDSTTIRLHREALTNYPDLSKLYLLLSKAALEIARTNKLLTTEQIHQLESVLND
ncbi:MAG: DUF2520 domain-containing protein [Ignavibacteria bacterium]|nr:DUF2520 domain-containing protein [Ignavibacteria bacterium]